MKKNEEKILCVCSSGGHLTEMIFLVDALGLDNPVFVTYAGNAEKTLKNSYFLKNMGTPGKPIDIFLGIFKIMNILLREKPRYIISTGSEIAFFVFYMAKLTSLFRVKLFYIECSAQVATPSFTGRLIYPITDLFFVQWRPLLKRYGKRARYSGNLIFGDV